MLPNVSSRGFGGEPMLCFLIWGPVHKRFLQIVPLQERREADNVDQWQKALFVYLLVNQTFWLDTV